MPDLPPEVITEILSRLPPKNLLCLRCVSKSWKSQIDGSDFIHLHLKKSIESRMNLTLILRKKSDLFSVDLDGTSEHAAIDLNHPLMCYSSQIRVLGSCNGLLCISNVAEDIAYWNPSTRKYRILPCLPLENTSNNRNDAPAIGLAASGYGFGFDSVHNDYKLVRISLFVGLYQSMSFESQVRVYSSRKNFWKPIENMPYVLSRPRKMGVLSNGCLHWVGKRKKLEGEEMGDFVVAFNLVDEDFKEFSIPEECQPSSRCKIDVGVLDGKLCLIANYREQEVQIRVEVLVMKEYGVKEELWTKLFTIPSQPGITNRSFNYVKPLAYSNSGNQVLLEKDHKLVWYDLKSQPIENVKFRALPVKFDAAGICVASLVSPNVCRDDDWKKHQSLHDKKSKKRDDFLSEGFKLVL